MSTRPFTFRLERVRALRERTEDLAKEDLAASLQHHLAGEAMLRTIAEELDGAGRKQRDRATAAPLAGTDLVAMQSYRERVERARAAAALDLDRREADVEARRSALQDASRDRQVLERLKDRRRADHTRDSLRREGAVTDEVALSVHRRRGAGR